MEITYHCEPMQWCLAISSETIALRQTALINLNEAENQGKNLNVYIANYFTADFQAEMASSYGTMSLTSVEHDHLFHSTLHMTSVRDCALGSYQNEKKGRK